MREKEKILSFFRYAFIILLPNHLSLKIKDVSSVIACEMIAAAICLAPYAYMEYQFLKPLLPL